MSLLDTGCGCQSKMQSIMANAESEKTVVNTGRINRRQKGQIPNLKLQNRRSAECDRWFIILEN